MMADIGILKNIEENIYQYSDIEDADVINLVNIVVDDTIKVDDMTFGDDDQDLVVLQQGKWDFTRSSPLIMDLSQQEEFENDEDEVSVGENFDAPKQGQYFYLENSSDTMVQVVSPPVRPWSMSTDEAVTVVANAQKQVPGGLLLMVQKEREIEQQMQQAERDDDTPIQTQKPMFISREDKNVEELGEDDRQQDTGSQVSPTLSSVNFESDMSDTMDTKEQNNSATTRRTRTTTWEITEKGQIMVKTGPAVITKIPQYGIIKASEVIREVRVKQCRESVAKRKSNTPVTTPQQSNIPRHRGPPSRYTEDGVARSGGLEKIGKNKKRHAVSSLSTRVVEGLLMDLYPQADRPTRDAIHKYCGNTWRLAFPEAYVKVMEQYDPGKLQDLQI